LTIYEWTNCEEKKLNALLYDLRHSDRVSNFVKQKEDKELLDYYYLTDEDSDNLTNLGVLFVGKQSQRGRLSNAPVVQCIKYDDMGEKVQKWLWDDYTMNPMELISDIWEKIPEWKESTEISDGLFRTEIPAYPQKVIRELLGNALVHRPYTIRGDIFINIHPHHIEVTNPGRLPLGVTADNILHTTKKRNEHMANLFYALKLMEREGSGYDMMYEVLLSQGKNVPIVVEGEDSVTAIVERKIVNQESIKVMQIAYRNYAIKQKQAICLGLIAQHESLTSSQLQKLLNLKDSRELRPWLSVLLDKGIVVSNDSHSKGKEYRIESRLLRDSHYKGKTSLKRIENYRIKELIIEDLKIYKRSKLTDIHQRIGAEIPYRRLQMQMQSLIQEGRVMQIGSKRWTQYELV
jgi:ATP-dependent DNA helicase RecG